MLTFECVFQEIELSAIQAVLPADKFCIVKFPGEQICYGVINEEFHSKLMDVLSGETLEHLEYPDEKVWKNIMLDKKAEFIGNKELLD